MSTMRLINILALCFLSCFTAKVSAFTFGGNKKSSGSALAKEAVAIFDKNYPFGREPPKPLAFNYGVPKREYKSNKRLSDITEKQAYDAFAALSKVYGEEAALEMVKKVPLALAFNKKIFQGSLTEWSGIFGEEEAKAMVLRNPGLLAVRPAEAAKANDQTMVFSYLVEATRPIGPIALPLIGFLLLTPLIEETTGIPIRSGFLESIGLVIIK